jgi:hypothetical protein
MVCYMFDSYCETLNKLYAILNYFSQRVDHICIIKKTNINNIII